MILTLSWLKNHLNTKASINEIIEKLTNIGLEVESIKEGAGNLSDFKIAKILKTEKHPNADKLKLCDVTTGGSSIKAVDKLRDAGYVVDRVVTLIDRQEGGEEAMKEAGLELVSIFKLPELVGKFL